MNIPRWLALAITAAWVVQLSALWPLPPDVIAQIKANLAVSTTALPVHGLDELEASAWISWFAWASIVPVGIASGILAMKHHRRWVAVFAVSSAAYFLILCPWSVAFAVHGHSLSSFPAFLSHVSWSLGQPMMTFATILFPVFISAVVVYVLVKLSRVKTKHAI